MSGGASIFMYSSGGIHIKEDLNTIDYELHKENGIGNFMLVLTANGDIEYQIMHRPDRESTMVWKQGDYRLLNGSPSDVAWFNPEWGDSYKFSLRYTTLGGKPKMYDIPVSAQEFPSIAQSVKMFNITPPLFELLTRKSNEHIRNTHSK
jgi:hypothetical protein